jgi:ATP-dependent Clp protease ATP-binding subunit ClpC
MEGSFSNRVQDAIRLSREEALRLGHDYIGIEHLLLGVIRLGEGMAVKILRNLNVDLFKLKKRIEDTIAVAKAIQTSGDIPLTRQAEKVLKVTYLEAKLHRSDMIGTEHLLLSLLRDDDNVAAQVLHLFDVHYDLVGNELDNIVTAGRAPITTFAPPAAEEGKSRLATRSGTVSAHLHSDVWTLDDKLGYSLYAKAIVEFICHRDTHPLRTISPFARP